MSSKYKSKSGSFTLQTIIAWSTLAIGGLTNSFFLLFISNIIFSFESNITLSPTKGVIFKFLNLPLALQTYSLSASTVKALLIIFTIFLSV